MNFVPSLDVLNAVQGNEIISCELHTHLPYTSTTFNNSDEIRIPIQQLDDFTHPHSSFIVIEGELKRKKSDGSANSDISLKMSNNFGAFLFEEIRYEIGSYEVDRIRNPGITSSMKNMLTLRDSDKNNLDNTGWNKNGYDPVVVYNAEHGSKFKLYLPLKLLFGFAEDYQKMMLNMKQELVLLRASSDNMAVYDTLTVADGVQRDGYSLTISKIQWKMYHLTLADEKKVEVFKLIESDSPLHMAFRKWNLYEYPQLPSSKDHVWTIKSTNQIEKPRYVIIGFQTDRKKVNSNSSNFDLCDLRNVKLFLNSVYYPYDNFNGDTILMYEMFKSFYYAYYNKRSNEPLVPYDKWLSNTPLIFINCSKQVESLRAGTIDIRLEFEFDKNVPSNTHAYCLLINDCVMSYTPLSGNVKTVM